MRNLNTACGRMPIWKWALLFVFGMFCMMFVMALAETVSIVVTNNILKPILSFVAGIVMLCFYSGWVWLFERRKPEELNIFSAPKNMLHGLGVGFGLFCLITAILAIIGFYKVESAGTSCSALLNALSFFFVVGVGEEIVFRGILYRMIDERFNTWVALLISAFIFGFVHYTNPNGTLWSSIAIAIEAGLMLALAYKYSGSLWLPIGIHWAWNFTQGNIFGFAVSGSNAGDSLLHPVVTGPDIITGGPFGPEASVIAAVFGLLISVAYYYGIRKKNISI